MIGRTIQYEYIDRPRKGDHICYISNLAKLRRHYPNWSITKSLDDIIQEMVMFELERVAA